MRRFIGVWAGVVVMWAVAARAGLVGYWTFDDATCVDSSSHGYDGTLVGGSYSTDVPAALGSGKSLDLTGADGRYAIIDSIAYGAVNDPFNLGSNITVSVWVKGWPNGEWEPFVAKRGETTGWQVRRYGTGSVVGWTARGTSSEDTDGTTTSAANGQWHHIACTYNGWNERIYVDGVLDRSLRVTGKITPSSERVVFGARENGGAGAIGSYAQVKLDNIAIFDEVLALNQVRYLAGGGSPTNAASVAPVVACWNFNDSTCTDQSGHGYYGTLNGGSYSTDVPAALAGGKSIDLTAGDHYVIIDSVAYNGTRVDPFIMAQNLTVSAWVKGWPGTWGPFVTKHGESTWGWQARKYGTTADHPAFTTRGLSNEDQDAGPSAMSDGNWHHIACTYDGRRKRVYVDGALNMSQAATGGIRDDCYERVVLGAREQGGPAITSFARVRLDDVAIFDKALAPNQILALARGVAATAVPAASSTSGLAYDFEDGTLQGWRNVLVSRSVLPGTDSIPTVYMQQYIAGSGLLTTHGGYGLRGEPYASSANDNRHATLLVRSPAFKLDGSGDLALWLAGGTGPATFAANEFSHVDLTHSINGTMRAYLRRASDGVYLLDMRRGSSGADPIQYRWTAAQLASYVSATETYTVDLVDSSDGSWGWVALDDVTIPGTLAPEGACDAIQFDMSQQRGNYLGAASPGHLMSEFKSGEKYWNGAGVDLGAGSLFWANGAPAPGVTFDVGKTTDGVGTGNVDWGQATSCARTDGGSGVYAGFLMRDWIFSDGNNSLAVRVNGLPYGDYKVLALVREPDAPGRTYDVSLGVNINYAGAPGAVQKSIAVTGSSTWVVGENYVDATLTVPSVNDYVTVIVRPTNAAWGSLQGLQIVNVTGQGTLFIVR